MIWKSLPVLLAVWTQCVLGQSSGSPTTSSAVPTISVSVGANGHLFTPDNITANVGDIIEYRFYPLNHSVARAMFNDPCIPIEYHEGYTGFWSGFHPMQAILTSPPTFQVRVNDTKPIFFYCSAPGSCQDGMVGVINGNSTQTLAMQKAAAKKAIFQLSPGEPYPAEVAKSTSISSSATPSASSTSASTASTTASTLPTPAAAAAGSPALSAGAIAGIAIGGAAVLILAAVLVYLCGRQRTLGEIIQRQNHTSVPPPYNPGPQGHMSMVSPPIGYGLKPYSDNDPLNAHRYSTQTGASPYEARSEVGAESYRSRSPAVDENMEVMIPPMNFAGGNGRASPVARRPVPQSPGWTSTGGMQSPTTPMAPGHEGGVEYPNPLRSKSQAGPHELSVENDRNYLPYVLRNDGGDFAHNG